MPATINVTKQYKQEVNDRWRFVSQTLDVKLADLANHLRSLIPTDILNDYQLDGFVGSVEDNFANTPVYFWATNRIIPLSALEQILVEVVFDRNALVDLPDENGLYFVVVEQDADGNWLELDNYDPNGYYDTTTLEQYPSVESAIQAWWSHKKNFFHVEDRHFEDVWRFCPTDDKAAWQDVLDYNRLHKPKEKGTENAHD